MSETLQAARDLYLVCLWCASFACASGFVLITGIFVRKLTAKEKQDENTS